MSQLLGKPEGFQQWSDQIHGLQEKDGLVKEASQEAYRKMTRMAKYREMMIKENLRVGWGWGVGQGPRATQIDFN